MESVLNLVVNAENVRILLLIVFGFSGFVWLKTSMTTIHRRIDQVEVSLGKRIDNLEVSLNKRIDELKYNDFAHLSSAVEALNVRLNALTYVLEKNGSLSKEDKEFVDTRLAH